MPNRNRVALSPFATTTVILPRRRHGGSTSTPEKKARGGRGRAGEAGPATPAQPHRIFASGSGDLRVAPLATGVGWSRRVISDLVVVRLHVSAATAS
ncbi:hypothetical protein GQ55_2G374200 [Panicum hallii var. hallii]|uniref:Uncharacterized protein n=1 Tax=Panicum hallii var. hallii TaxID=1504633 RepID=A0A2T7EWI7_9POAL|nr:hypothetical protein GQ55_2G374200 [Panicum hallii var. hallii]